MNRIRAVVATNRHFYPQPGIPCQHRAFRPSTSVRIRIGTWRGSDSSLYTPATADIFLQGLRVKIKDAKVFVCSPGRNFVTLKIYTDEGVYGLGDATLNGRELSVASYLTDHILPCLIGRDPFQTEDIAQFLYRGAYWRKGPVTMTAIAAVDMALWDIKAKALKTPLYNLLGGKSRSGVMVYGHANGRDISETLEETGKYIEHGYLAVRAQSGVPGR